LPTPCPLVPISSLGTAHTAIFLRYHFPSDLGVGHVEDSDTTPIPCLTGRHTSIFLAIPVLTSTGLQALGQDGEVHGHFT